MVECMKEDKLPLDDNVLEETHAHYMNVVNEKFDEKLKSLLDPQKAKELKAELNAALRKDYEARAKYNSEKSESRCKELLNKFFNYYRFPELDNVENVTASLVQEKYEEYRKGIKEYLDRTKAPKKCRISLTKISTLWRESPNSCSTSLTSSLKRSRRSILKRISRLRWSPSRHRNKQIVYGPP